MGVTTVQGFQVPRGRFLETSALTSVLVLAGCLAVGALALNATPAFANPVNGTVVGGSASIGGQPGEVVVRQSTDKAIIDWQGFSIAPGEITRFVQPSANAITLNRVTGGARSDIAGSLQANGNIWLVNPNGILIKSGARVDVGGLLATTADIRNQDFMAGAYNFDRASTNPDAGVVNEGTITLADRGIAALVAPHVRNSGVIEGRLSQVVLAGAPTFLVDFQGDGLMRFEATGVVEKAPEGVQELVRNNGIIRAPGGRVTMTARAASGILDKVINTDGVVEAQSVQNVNGTIVLSGEDSGTVAVSGRLDVQGKDPGTVGGTVQVTGQKVAIESGARIDARGRRGGGTVQIGGGPQGKGLRFNAKQTKVAAGAQIDASATERGDGGQVIVWSDKSTEFSGSIVARGAGTGGNGGFAEVSGKSSLSFHGSVDLAAADQGRAGTLLIDPTDIVIDNADSNVTGSPNYQPDGTNPAAATIDAATLSGFLNAGTNVTIVTNSSGSGSGNITVAAAIVMNGAGNTATLSLQADGGITVLNTGSITLTAGTLNVTMNAAGGGVALDGIISINGNLSITASGSITQSTALTVGGTSSFSAGANAITLGNAGNALTGAVTLTNSGTNDATLTNTLATAIAGTI
ncbi:filamentous hemagglutinin N-terminal domain-containing protein, partial [Azospirillum argentinense]|uniref:two-partner secretion domain-containing protein n=1 Tax=Azospirillum argentinense TaxID=2970906 RepID=UPI0032DEC5F3